MNYHLVIFLIIFCYNGSCVKGAEVTGKQYASIPEVFFQDNFDNCMMREDEAFYCALTYEVEPIDKETPSETWEIIKNLSKKDTNYRHERIRRWICVPKFCSGINKTHNEDPKLREGLKRCYDAKFRKFGLNGTITEVDCVTNEPKYPFDSVDYFAAILFSSYIIFVLLATIYEGFARYKTPEVYQRLMGSRCGKFVAAFSITRNWIRLKTVNSTPEIERLRHIQGIRVYNTALVILCHTLLGFVGAPVANTRFTETMHLKNARVFFSSGPLCVATFFLISTFLLSTSIFDYMKEKTLNIKTILFIFVNRLFRLTPTVFAVVLFHATLLRHLGSGPNWHQFVTAEFLKCRKNGWLNILYINNWVDPQNMCLPVTWYLALDTQYFLATLFFLWFIKSYEKYAWYIIGSAVACNVIGTFIHNYYYDFTALVLPTPEAYFGIKDLFTNVQFHTQMCSLIGNTGAPLMGIAFGYYYHKNKHVRYYTTKARIAVWWLSTFVLGFGLVLIPGFIILNDSVEHDRFWASVYVGLSRAVFGFVIGTGLIGFTEGIGWLALRVVQWGPTYVLGRLSFSAYLIHMSIVLIRPSLARFPIHLSDFQVVLGFFGDLAIVYIASTLLTLCLEMPISELQKQLLNPKGLMDQSAKADEKKEEKND
ncbi:O-acyltransferase like protein-like [Anthonomus grandis grandis]|uniref:O-acyltransferase like protein-like n=1 Tax=Anthonomus grandis grandis TaxID=2921223 RepID=UPI0021664909|nr:O-acyltransferase like protein-like [Anthonomus grandis grandis]